MEKGQGKGTDTLKKDNDFVRRGDVKCLLENTVCLHEELPAQIDIIPAADVAPVRHGRWVFNDELDDMFHCTVCDNVAVRNTFNYCPNCGARMDGDGDV